MRNRLHKVSAILFTALTSPLPAIAAGPDVIVGFVDDGREDSRQGGKIGLTASTNSCNVGDAPLNWYRLPDAHHPAITLNFYRLLDGRIEQLARSWVKHGFYATNQNACATIAEMMGRPCQSGSGGTQLRPGCSDLYGEDLNADPRNLGPRSRINNAATGEFDGAKARDLTGYPKPCEKADKSDCPDPAEQILLVAESVLAQPTARYFLEGHYVAADDAVAGNAHNNVSYREVQPILRSGAWVLKNLSSDTVRTQPAVIAWKEAGAQLSEIDTAEGNAKTYIIVGSRVSSAPSGKFRYDFVVYNMNSDLAVQSLSVPAAGVDASSIGFSAAPSNAEIWSNDAWQHRVENGQVIWSTKGYAEDSNANAIRWGAAYNFWFVSDKGPANADATIGRFKPVPGNLAETAVTRVVAPGP
jgi:hypothetical protein